MAETEGMEGGGIPPFLSPSYLAEKGRETTASDMFILVSAKRRSACPISGCLDGFRFQKLFDAHILEPKVLEEVAGQKFEN